MTKEIWAAVIIAIVQIIVAVAIGWKQISIAKALANPEQNQEKQSTGQLTKILKYFPKIPFHIIIPSLLFVFVAFTIVAKFGFNIVTGTYIIFMSILIVVQALLWLMTKIIETILSAMRKYEKRFKCHESILFNLTDRPCKEDGTCKFDA